MGAQWELYRSPCRIYYRLGIAIAGDFLSHSLSIRLILFGSLIPTYVETE